MREEYINRIEKEYQGKYEVKGGYPEKLAYNSKLTFICKQHGDFEKYLYQVFRRKEGCPKCSKLGAPSLSHEEFVNKVELIYPKGIPFKFLETYKGYHTRILIEYKGIKCSITPDHILRGVVGNMRNTLDKTSFMKMQFREKHGQKYDYSKYEYTGNRKLGKIICPEHGEFSQMTDVHLMGSGCPKCGSINKKTHSWSRTKYSEMFKDRVCTFYIIRCYNEEEDFLKIGITSSSVEKRYKGRHELPYTYEILKEVQGTPEEVWDLELEHKRKYREHHYIPNKFFKGCKTECFSIELYDKQSNNSR